MRMGHEVVVVVANDDAEIIANGDEMRKRDRCVEMKDSIPPKS